MVRVTVTGAEGFIGAALCMALLRAGHDVDAIGRPGGRGGLQLADTRGWSDRLKGVDAVVHLAARAHVTNDKVSDPLALFRAVNVEGTQSVATAAINAGVRRFVFVSSIGVYGTVSDAVLSEQSPIRPEEAYAVSKWEAEQRLGALARSGKIELVIVRPTLVYGPNAKGNILRLMKLVASGVPLPFASIRNSRSFIAVNNLADLLVQCVQQAGAAGQVFVAADDEDISTPGLLTMLSAAMRRPDRQFHCPLPLLRIAMTALGRSTEFIRLTNNLVVDARHAREVLEWRGNQDLRSGIQQMVDAYLGTSSGQSSGKSP